MKSFVFALVFLTQSLALASSYFCHRIFLPSFLEKFHFDNLKDADGSGWSELLISKNRPDAIFIKVMDLQKRKPEQFIMEAKMMRILQGLEFVPDFKGLEVLQDGRFALVSAYSEFVVTLPSRRIGPKEASFLKENSLSILSQVEFNLTVLHQKGVIPHDYQLGVTQSGRVMLIDFEFYMLSSSPARLPYDFAKESILRALAPYLPSESRSELVRGQSKGLQQFW